MNRRTPKVATSPFGVREFIPAFFALAMNCDRQLSEFERQTTEARNAETKKAAMNRRTPKYELVLIDLLCFEVGLP